MDFTILTIIFAVSLSACLLTYGLAPRDSIAGPIAMLLSVVIAIGGTLGLCWIGSQPTRDLMDSVRNQADEGEPIVENLQATAHPELWKIYHPETYEEFEQIMIKVDPTYDNITLSLKTNEERTSDHQFFIMYDGDSRIPIVTSKYFLLKGNQVSLFKSE